MIPYFFLNVQKTEDYTVYNPVDNHEYLVNYAGLRILENCDGANSPEQIASLFAKEFGETQRNSGNLVASFLKTMTKRGMITWRDAVVPEVPDWGPPETVFWDITARCNLRCSHCYYTDESAAMKELSTNEIRRGIDELAAFGVANLVVSGGEPMLRKDALEIVSHAAGCSFADVSLVTNGTLIDNHAATTLKKTGVSVQVSIDGDTAPLHDAIRGREGAFDSAVNGIKLLQEEGVPVSVCTVASTMNVDKIPAIIALMQELHVDAHRVQGIMPMGRGRSNEKQLRLTPTRMKRLSQFLESQSVPVASYTFTLKDPPSDPVCFDESGACAAATSCCSINPEGNVVPCTHFWGIRADNLRHYSFRWIWENSPVLRYFRSISLREVKGSCRKCDWLALCHGGCKAENFIAGDIFASNRSCWVGDKNFRAAKRRKRLRAKVERARSAAR
jgi:radical SAM protein with 4Fe4S-binding SPASM domain